MYRVLPAFKTRVTGLQGDNPLGKQWGYLFIDDFWLFFEIFRNYFLFINKMALIP